MVTQLYECSRWTRACGATAPKESRESGSEVLTLCGEVASVDVQRTAQSPSRSLQKKGWGLGVWGYQLSARLTVRVRARVLAERRVSMGLGFSRMKEGLRVGGCGGHRTRNAEGRRGWGYRKPNDPLLRVEQSSERAGMLSCGSWWRPTLLAPLSISSAPGNQARG